MAFCVQLAAEPTSVAAPRTVLQAASATQVPTNNAVITFDFMSTLLTYPEQQ
jgi:hypothetical protein